MKEMSLGTAMWGWSVTRETAFLILDYFYKNGGRFVDTSSNYPMNGVDADFGISSKFLSDWCATNDVSDLKITYKIGSVCNRNTPLNDLTYTKLCEQMNWALDEFGSNLNCLMLHWDDRNDRDAIAETCEFLNVLNGHNLEVGLSGIRDVESYGGFLKNIDCLELNIQAKHNFLHDGLFRYKSLNSLLPKYWGYGISVGGLKLSVEEYHEQSNLRLVRGAAYHDNVLSDKQRNILLDVIRRNTELKSIYQVALAFSEAEERLFGYIVAPSTIQQISDTYEFRRKVEFTRMDLSDIYNLKGRF